MKGKSGLATAKRAPWRPLCSIDTSALNSRHMNRELGQRYPNSLRRNKDFNRCGLPTLTTHCEKEAIQVRRKIACASAFHGVDSPKFGVVICILLFEHRDRPIASARIDSFSTLVVEHVVAVAHRRELLNNISVVGIEDEQSSGHASNHKQSAIAFVECHRIVSECHVGFPSRNYGVFLTINHDDLARLRQIYINSWAVFLVLKFFWTAVRLILP